MIKKDLIGFMVIGLCFVSSEYALAEYRDYNSNEPGNDYYYWGDTDRGQNYDSQYYPVRDYNSNEPGNDYYYRGDSDRGQNYYRVYYPSGDYNSNEPGNDYYYRGSSDRGKNYYYRNIPD